MRRFKRKGKTTRGEPEERSINWRLIGILALIIVPVCVLLVVLAVVLWPRDTYVIKPYGYGATATVTRPPTEPPTFTPIPATSTPVSPTPAPVPVMRIITVDTVRDLVRVAALPGHSNTVSSVAFSPDGARLASGSQDGTLRVWNVAQRAEIGATTIDSEWVNSVAYSPDGEWLAVAGQDAQVRLWNVADVIAGTERPIVLPDGPTDAVNSVAYSPDGRLLAAASDDGRVYVWNAVTREIQQTLTGHASYVICVAFNSDGTVLAAGGADRSIHVWKVESGQELLVLEGHSGTVNALAFSPDGAWLASAGAGGTVRVWDAVTGDVVHVLEGHTGSVGGLAFDSQDATLLASAAEGGVTDDTVRFWAMASGQELHALQFEASVKSIAISADGRYLAVGGAGATGLSLWSVVSLAAGPTATPVTLPASPGTSPAAGSTALPTLTGGGTATPVPTLPPADTACTVSVTGVVNKRVGPGLEYGQVGVLNPGDVAAVQGWALDTDQQTWWRLADGSWVWAGVVDESDLNACMQLPRIEPE